MWNKLKNTLKTNKAAVLTGVVLLLSLGLIVGVTAAANRARRAPGELGETTTTGGSSVPILTTTDPATTTRPSTGTPGGTTPTGTATTPAKTTAAAAKPDEPPAFALPVSGAMMKGHDLTMQVFSNTMQDWRVHSGIDIAATLGAPVYAAADGTVKQIWEDVSFGTCVAVAHSGDCISYYKNLSPILAQGITVDAKVKQGQLIAAVGESSMIEIADEPHLHFEISVGGEAVDPTDFFDSASVAVLEKDEAYEG